MFNRQTTPRVDFKMDGSTKDLPSDAITTNRPGTKNPERVWSETDSKKQTDSRGRQSPKSEETAQNVSVASLVHQATSKHQDEQVSNATLLEFARIRNPVQTAAGTVPPVARAHEVAPAPAATNFTPTMPASVVSTNAETLNPAISSQSSETPATTDKVFSGEWQSSAIRVILSILQDDELLVPPHESARGLPKIPHVRLREAIVAFAKRLEKEADNDLQHEASRLVRAKASYLAAKIVMNIVMRGEKWYLIAVPGELDELTGMDLEGVSEKERVRRSGDLQALRLFLTGSEAYKTLQGVIRAFSTKEAKPPTKEPVDTVPLIPPPQSSTPAADINVEEIVQLHAETSTPWARLMRYLKEMTAFMVINLLVAMGCLEPPLQAGRTRITVECLVSQRFPTQHPSITYL